MGVHVYVQCATLDYLNVEILKRMIGFVFCSRKGHSLTAYTGTVSYSEINQYQSSIRSVVMSKLVKDSVK